MTSRPFGSLTTILTAVTAVLAVECLAPASLEAGCGDYVHLGRSPGGMSFAEERPRPESHDSGSRADHPPLPAGCQGPACRGEQPQPTAPVNPPVPASFDDWASLADSAPPDACDQNGWTPDSEPAFMSRHSRRIDRPPRAGS